MNTITLDMDASAFVWLGEQPSVELSRGFIGEHWRLRVGGRSFKGECLADVVCDAHEELCLQWKRKEMRDSEE